MGLMSTLLLVVILVGVFHEEVIDTMADVRDYWRLRFGPVPPPEEDQPER